MASNLIISTSIIIPASEINLSFSRSSGAGGQNVNKVNSKVTLRWHIDSSQSVSHNLKEKFKKLFTNSINNQGEYVVYSSEYRDQAKNIRLCYEKLKSCILKAAKKDKKRIKTKPSYTSREKRLTAKKVHSGKKSFRRKFNSSDN